MSIESETQLLAADFAMLAHLLRSRGFSQQQIVSATSIPADALDDSDGLMSYAQYKQLILKAIKITGDPALGLEFGKTLNFSTSGPLSMGVWACKTFTEALHLVKRIVYVLNPGIKYTVESDDEYLHLGILEALPWGETESFMVDVTFGFISANTHFFDPDASPGVIYQCRHDAKPNREHYEKLLEGKIQFNAESNRVSIPREFCERPLPFNNPKAVENAEAFLEKKMIEVNNTDNRILYPIKLMLRNSIGQAPTLEDVAKLFHISSRTLNRRLKGIGTTFKEVATDVRKERALNYLKETNLSIDEIAYNLGYQDTSNFTKAFKSWTGMTPSGYRQSN